MKISWANTMRSVESWVHNNRAACSTQKCTIRFLTPCVRGRRIQGGFQSGGLNTLSPWQGCYSYPADVWSAGVILYILLSGLPPFQGNNERDIFRRVLRQPLDLQSEPWPHISAGAKDLVSRLSSVLGKVSAVRGSRWRLSVLQSLNPKPCFLHFHMGTWGFFPWGRPNRGCCTLARNKKKLWGRPFQSA